MNNSANTDFIVGQPFSYCAEEPAIHWEHCWEVVSATVGYHNSSDWIEAVDHMTNTIMDDLDFYDFTDENIEEKVLELLGEDDIISYWKARK